MVMRDVLGFHHHVVAPQNLPCPRRHIESSTRETHTVVLPHVLAFNQPAVPTAVGALSRALGGTKNPATRLWELAHKLGAPMSLQELGMDRGDIPSIAKQVHYGTYGNPREASEEDITRILNAAWTGRL